MVYDRIALCLSHRFPVDVGSVMLEQGRIGGSSGIIVVLPFV